MREGGEKLTKIYPKSYFDFRSDYSLKFCFPKKVNFFIDGKIFYRPLCRGHFFSILAFVLKIGGKKQDGSKR